MTDETPEQPRQLRVFTCVSRRHPTRSCYALIEDTDEARRLHREWHAGLEAANEGQRAAIKARDEEIARLREDIAGYRRDLNGYEQEVSRVSTPDPIVPIEINRAGYTDDEDDDPTDPDDADMPVTAEWLNQIPPQPTAAEEALDDDDVEDDDRDTIDHPSSIRQILR